MSDAEKNTERKYPDQWIYAQDIMDAFRDLEEWSRGQMPDFFRSTAIRTAIELSFSPLHYKQVEEEAKAHADRAPTCPTCKTKMRLCVAKTTGNKFWGCSNYPICNFTLDYDKWLETEKSGGNATKAGPSTADHPSSNIPQGKPAQTDPASITEKAEFKTADKFDSDKEPEVKKASNESDKNAFLDSDEPSWAALKAEFPNFPKAVRTNTGYYFECPKCHGPMDDKRYSKKGKQPDFVCQNEKCVSDKKGKNGRAYRTGIWLERAKEEYDHTDDEV